MLDMLRTRTRSLKLFTSLPAMLASRWRRHVASKSCITVADMNSRRFGEEALLMKATAHVDAVEDARARKR